MKTRIYAAPVVKGLKKMETGSQNKMFVNMFEGLPGIPFVFTICVVKKCNILPNLS